MNTLSVNMELANTNSIIKFLGITILLGLMACQNSNISDTVKEKLAQKTKPIQFPYSATNFEYLDPLIKDIDIVQLGESIHMTHEFPLVRNEVVKYLNKQQNFDVIAFEGSAIDTWIGMDYLINTPDTLDYKKVQEYAWFGLWQTQEMQEIIQTVHTSRETSNPLYLAAFDIQPGSARRYQNIKVFDALFQRLKSYKEYDDEKALQRWKQDFSYLVHCRGFENDSLRRAGALEQIEESITEFDSLWIRELVPMVSATKGSAHGIATQLLPDNLKDRHCHCSEVVKKGIIDWRRYQTLRDSLNAQNVLMIKDSLSANKKVITWAHHSHINYNSGGKNIPSMGQYLKNQIGEEVYSIGCFAGSGKALIANDDWLFPILSLNIKATTEIENILAQLEKDHFFLNTKALKDDPDLVNLFSSHLSSRMEHKSQLTTNLVQDFDGLIYCHKINPPDFLIFKKVMKKVPVFLGWVYEKYVLLIFVLLFLIGLSIYKRKNSKTVKL